MGGLDLFLLDSAEDKSLIKRNLGLPINSEGDDFGMVLRSPVSGFFSSNREGGAAKGNDDIYSFTNDSLSQKKVIYCLRGTTFADENGKPEILPGTEVVLSDAAGKTVGTITTDAAGKFQFDNITPEQVFELIGTKVSYVRAHKNYSTVGKSVNPLTLPGTENTICFDVELDLFRDLFGGGKMPELLILYKYDDDRITPEAAKLLDDFMEFLNAYFDEHFRCNY